MTDVGVEVAPILAAGTVLVAFVALALALFGLLHVAIRSVKGR
jgi:hypothetical protein